MPEDVLIDSHTEKEFGTPYATDHWRHLQGFGLFTVGYDLDEFRTYREVTHIRHIPTHRLDLPPNVLELWAQVAVRGELGPDGEFLPWDEVTWEKKQQELAAIPPPYPDVPFPGYLATDRLHWLRAAYIAAAEEGLANELLRKAEAIGDNNEVVRWRTECAKYVREVAPQPREVKP